MNKPRQPRYADIFRGDAEKEAEAKAVWHEVVGELDEKGLITETRLKIADRYARACAEYAVLYPIAASEGPVKTGPNGGDVFNFNWSACEKLNDRMAKFEDQLRLDLRHSDVSEKPAPANPTKADDYLD
ncbi:hypothetical protein GN330_16545 [Nitratireductor sp. CAU 1489]|uniref:Phage terminase, small subunit, putative, P27 family n=1 Tax=Nitratireductor arenosus TaxID=2682096 RepID=A0A844QLD1_9HYPH|nr:P27 family phage terminase small subunit [Nitratireductor arenosus]MVA98858.1 hypothetical protein [Nitratireductor arenosus]